jgi:hypothetical protein
VEEEQFLLAADLAVVALGGLGEEVLVLGHLLLVRERDAVQPLQRVVLLRAEEVRGGVLARLPSAPGPGYSCPAALTFSTLIALIRPVCGMCGPTHRSTIGPHRYTVVLVPSGIFDEMMCCLYLLYWRGTRVSGRPQLPAASAAHLEHLQQVLLRHDAALELLLVLNRALDQRLERAKVLGLDRRAGRPE